MPDRIRVPLIVACALFMENLDSTVLSTALPAIAADFGASPIHLKLALTSYLLAIAVFIPASGWAADRFGSRAIFRLAIITFTVGSILSGFSGSIGELVFARIIQGIGGAMMVPVGRLVILRTVSKAELVRSLAWLTVPALIGPVMGPPVGGFITTYIDWPWIFWINIPVGLLGLVLATLYIPDVRGESCVPFDRLGFPLSGIGLAAFMTGSTSLGLKLLPTWLVMSLLIGGTGLLAAYVAYSRKAVAPIIDLTLIRIPTFGLSLAGSILFRIGIGATPFLLPLLAVADMPPQRMSRATTLTSVAQQLSLSTGISVGAITLALTARATGGVVTASAFWPAFVVVGLITLAAVIPLRRLSTDAGDEMSGRQPAPDPVTIMRDRG